MKFAEQKNAALLVLNCGVALGFFRILTKQGDLSSIANYLNFGGYVCLFVSAITCLHSFVPILQIPWFKIGNKSSSDNCVFFGHIAKYQNNEYLVFLSNKLSFERQKFTGFELDLASQIVTNSEIALNKYKQFRFSSLLTIVGIFSFGMSLLITFIG